MVNCREENSGQEKLMRGEKLSKRKMKANLMDVSLEAY